MDCPPATPPPESKEPARSSGSGHSPGTSWPGSTLDALDEIAGELVRRGLVSVARDVANARISLMFVTQNGSLP
jgi:hypothetical protein